MQWLYSGYIKVMLGVILASEWDNGKENGNCCILVVEDISGIYRDMLTLPGLRRRFHVEHPNIDLSGRVLSLRFRV